MNQWISWIIQTVTMLAIGAVVYLLQDMKKSIDTKINENKDEIKAVKKELDDFKDKIPLQYVLRDDFIRAMTNVDKKLDEITRILLQRKGGE